MRDPARIDRILGIVKTIWKRAPDLRLMQLLINAVPRMDVDQYYFEDDELEKALKYTYFDQPEDEDIENN